MNETDEHVSIRQATADDAVLISVLASTTFYEAYFEQDESANLAGYISETFEINGMRIELIDPDSTFFLIFLDGKAVGFAKLITNSRVDCISQSKVIELKRIYILERVWKSGVGKMLLEHCIAEARSRDFDVLWLGVWEENARAQRFYAKFGFTEVGTISFPYGDVVGTNLVLEKRL